MYVPALLLVLSALGCVLSVYVFGASLNAGVVLALICAAAAIWLFIRARLSDWIIIDGSNVMYWHDNTPKLMVVAHVAEMLDNAGMKPIVWFDANVGYLVGDRYMGPAALSRVLGMSRARVFVAPKGTPADPLLLKMATVRGARVVSNDRFRDWKEMYPKIAVPGFLVRGQADSDGVHLEAG